MEKAKTALAVIGGISLVVTGVLAFLLFTTTNECMQLYDDFSDENDEYEDVMEDADID